MADLTTLLSKFLADLYAGTAGSTVPLTSLAITGPGAGVTLTNPSTTVLNVSGTVQATAGGAILGGGGDVTLQTGRFLRWTAQSSFSSSTDAQILVTNFANTVGVGVDVATDATLKVRTRAMADTAIVDASRFQAGGTGGVVTFGPAAVASITVKGGIITAIS